MSMSMYHQVCDLKMKVLVNQIDSILWGLAFNIGLVYDMETWEPDTWRTKIFEAIILYLDTALTMELNRESLVSAFVTEAKQEEPLATFILNEMTWDPDWDRNLFSNLFTADGKIIEEMKLELAVNLYKQYDDDEERVNSFRELFEALETFKNNE